MITRYANARPMAVAFLATTFLCGSQIFAQTKDQDEDVYSRTAETLRKADRDNRARRIARERYALWSRLEQRWGLYLDYGSFNCISIFYPVLRSDRVYVLLWNAPWPRAEQDTKNEMLCFQRKNTNVKLVYTIHYRDQRSRPVYMHPPKSLSDYLHVHGCTLSGRVSPYAIGDMTAARDYVKYDSVTYTNSLWLSLMSELNNTGNYDDKMEMHYLDKDPFTKQELKSSEFYRKYGFPVTGGELALLNNTRKQRRQTGATTAPNYAPAGAGLRDQK